MNQTSILQEGSLRVEDVYSKSIIGSAGSYHGGRGTSMYQYQSNNAQGGGGITSRGGAPPQVKTVQTPNGANTIGSVSQKGGGPSSAPPTPYKVQVNQASQDSRSRANQLTSNINGSTFGVGRVGGGGDSTVSGSIIKEQSFSKKFFGCSLNLSSFFCMCMQIIEKFFFFTLFLSAFLTKILEILIGVVFAVASVLKYILFIYLISIDLSVVPPPDKAARGGGRQDDNNQSDDESVASQKQRFCVKCDQRVHQETCHCDHCKKCVYHTFFHSKILGLCVAQRNKTLVKLLIALNFAESILALIAGGLALVKLLSNQESFKANSSVNIFQQSSGGVLVVVAVVVLVAVVSNVILSIWLYRLVRMSNKFKKERPASQTLPLSRDQPSIGGAGMLQQSIIEGTMRSNLRHQGSSHSATLRYHQPTFVQSISGISQSDQRRFESHWKISPPDGRIDDNNPIMSMNSSGTIFNFISKKMASCENIEKLSVQSPGKSVKSLSSIDHSTVFKSQNPKHKSMNFSDIEIVSKYASEKPPNGVNTYGVNSNGTINTQNAIASMIPVQSNYSRKMVSSMKQSTTSSKKRSLPPIQESLRQLNAHRDMEISNNNNASIAPSQRKKSDGGGGGYLESANTSILSNNPQAQFKSPTKH